MMRAMPTLMGVLTISLTAEAAGAERLAGNWSVQFANGVYQWCVIRNDRTASVMETHRTAAGRAETVAGALVVRYDDDRVERWTAVDRRAVVEHWFPGSTYPQGKPVLGIAKAMPLGAVNGNEPADADGNRLRMAVTSKSFAATLRTRFTDETAGELRQFIDPRYLEQHRLLEGAFPIQRIVTGAIFDNSPVDDETMFVVVGTEEAEQEVWLLRLVVREGKAYVVPPSPPEPTTRVFRPWLFRTRL